MKLETGTLVGGALLSAPESGHGELVSRPVGSGRELAITGLRRARSSYAVYDAEQLGTRRRCVLTAFRRYASAAAHARLDLADPAVIAAVRAASVLDHENLERVLAVGVDESMGCVYVATPHVEAETLASSIAKSGPLGATDARPLLERVASALGALHAAGFVHGAVLPEHVFVPSDGDATSITLAGQTFVDAEPDATDRPWLAPERLPGAWVDATSGAVAGPDPRSDVWSLGLLAFFALAGRPYWRESEAGEIALAREILLDPLVSASLRAVEFGVVLPLSFDAWFARCVSRDPSLRFSDANAAAAELGRALGENAVLAAPTAGSLAPQLLPPMPESAPPPRPLYVAQSPAAPPRAVLSRFLGKLPFARGNHPAWVAPAFASVGLVCVTAVVIAFLARSSKAPEGRASGERVAAREEPVASAEAPKVKQKGPWAVDAEPDPRTKTVLVNVTPSPELVDGFRTMALTLESSHLRNVVSGLTLGGSGSGFVLVRQRDAKDRADGARATAPSASGSEKDAQSAEPAVFVLTNRHVVAEGEAVELTLDDGAKLGADVVYSDLRHDVAVLSFTGKRPPFTTGLRLAPTDVADLAPVVATGYPFLAGKPSFQISRGEVRNRAFERSFDEEGTKETYIQHSASIDPGSSGGPLLDANNDVVGINTGFLPEKHDVYLALPGAVIDDAIAHALEIQEKQSSAEWRLAGVQKACKELVGELASETPRFRTFQQLVSNGLVASEGLASLLVESALTSTAPSGRGPSPMDRMRLAVLRRLYVTVKDRGGLAADPCGDVNPTDAADIVHTPVVRMTLRLADGTSEIAWTFEHGHFRIASVPSSPRRASRRGY
ncbi:MAG: trypsin-like peptidase domain-containing protein [Polyangiaceae bacterium]